MERSGKQVSLNKISKTLKITPDTARRYLEMFSGTFLIYPISRCGKTNERLLSPKKIYAADLGIRVLFTGFRDIGSLFENYVYLKIKHLNPCYIYKKGIEIDFYTSDKTLLEIKYNYEMKSKQRDVFDSIQSKSKYEIKNIYELQNYLESYY